MCILIWINAAAMLAPSYSLRIKGENHDTSKKATFAVTSCSISFIRISAPTVDNLRNFYLFLQQTCHNQRAYRI
jgi:hypothetical protein